MLFPSHTPLSELCIYLPRFLPCRLRYAVIHEKHSSDQGAKLAGSGLGDDDDAAEPVKYAPAKIKGKLADFTNMITSADMFADQYG